MYSYWSAEICSLLSVTYRLAYLCYHWLCLKLCAHHVGAKLLHRFRKILHYYLVVQKEEYAICIPIGQRKNVRCYRAIG